MDAPHAQRQRSERDSIVELSCTDNRPDSVSLRTSIGGMSNRYVVIEGGVYLTDIRNTSRNPTAVPRRCESKRPALGAPIARRYAIPNAV